MLTCVAPAFCPRFTWRIAAVPAVAIFKSEAFADAGTSNALLASLALLQPVKGAVVGMQWALRMHGFDENNPEP